MKKNHGQGAGISVPKTIWDLFDLFFAVFAVGIRKHSGTPAWLLAFARQMLAEVPMEAENKLY
jgi:hypothetical protein